MSAQPTEQYTSRTEHRAALRSAPLVVEIEQKVTVTTQIDVVGFFAGLPAVERGVYHDEDIRAKGFSDYERPMVYLNLCLDAEVMEPVGGHHVMSSVDSNDWEERVEFRKGTRASGHDRYWSEADYDALLAAVAWMRPEDHIEADPADLARIPGPLDDPIF